MEAMPHNLLPSHSRELSSLFLNSIDTDQAYEAWLIVLN